VVEREIYGAPIDTDIFVNGEPGCALAPDRMPTSRLSAGGGRVDHHRPGPARPWRRAARFGVSPIAVCWRESPEPIGSPMTTGPVAMPMLDLRPSTTKRYPRHYGATATRARFLSAKSMRY
jgi:hypothetical protein